MITKQYILEQIEKVKEIIKEGTKYRYDNKLMDYEFNNFGHATKLDKFKKSLLMEYLEVLVTRAYELELLDNTFTY